MKFMMMVKTTAASANIPPSQELMDAVGKMTEEGMKNGTIIGIGGLMPLATGTRVRVASGKLTVTDGPFAEAKEVIGGYCIAEVASTEQALKMAKDFMQMHIDVLGAAWEGESEVRELAAYEVVPGK